MFGITPFSRNTGLSRSIFDELDKMWESPLFTTTTYKGLDVSEDEKAYYVALEAPGYDKDKIAVTCEDGLLTVNIEKETKTDDKKYHCKSISRSSFTQSIQLPDGLEVENANSEYKAGILTITIPKGERAKPKKIPVKSGESS